MATLTIRNLDEQLRDQLRVRAAEHGRSMEAEARAILKESLEKPAAANLGDRIQLRFASIGGVELDIPARDESPRSPKFL